ncbi:MAG: hypothetical protein IJU40_02930, partial [Desulfovibrionaceae bacterium]|nr:hypothetical protein [Desulfovibrionaceae bacterium]
MVSLDLVLKLRSNLIVEISSQTKEAALKSLQELLGPHLKFDNEGYYLEYSLHERIPLEFEELEEPFDKNSFPMAPILRDIGLLSANTHKDQIDSTFLNLPTRIKGEPELHTFFSFKGGVGRTMALTSLVLHAVKNMQSSVAEPKILLIDADTEAPGLTYWMNEEFSDSPFSYLDLLAVTAEALHQGQDPSWAVEKAANYIQSMRFELLNSQQTIYFLPAFKNNRQLFRQLIKPDSLALSTENPWLIGKIFFDLGTKLKVNHIFVDLRSGLSELSGPLFYDPRVQRTLVTSTSEQSIAGTLVALERLATLQKFFATTDYVDRTRLLINFIPPNEHIDQITERLEAAMQEFFNDKEAASPGSWLFTSGFDQKLLGLGKLIKALSVLDKSETLKNFSRNFWAEFKNKEDVKSVNQEDLDNLEKITYELIFAELVEWQNSFLSIVPYRNLVTSMINQTPNVCIMGAKGSGKTFLFRILTSCKNWQQFCTNLKIKSDYSIPILPVFASKNFSPENLKITKDVFLNAQKVLTSDINQVNYFNDISFQIENAFASVKEKSLTEWRNDWFKILTMIFNINISEGDPETLCKQYLANSKKHVLLLID